MKLLLDYELLEGCAVVLCRWKLKKKKRQKLAFGVSIYIFSIDYLAAFVL